MPFLKPSSLPAARRARRRYCSAGLLAISLLLMGTSAQPATAGTGVCLLDGRGSKNGDMPDCPTETNTTFGGKTNAALGFAGARVNHGPALALTPIDPTDGGETLISKCRYVDASSGGTNNYFVPFHTAVEWESFLSVADNGKLTGIATRHCARPFASTDSSLYFGHTSARSDLGDTPSEASYLLPANTLPYWPTGSIWPPEGVDSENGTHPFSYSCDEEVSEAKCLNWVNVSQTCCTGTYTNGVCSGSTYDCSYSTCNYWGSECKTIKHTWQETFDIKLLALDSDTTNPSWARASSTCVAGSSRPDACLKRCKMNSDGTQCDCKTVQSTTPESKCPDTEPTQKAACGCADGSHFKKAPAASKLCSIGTVSAFVETTTGWSWTCTEGTSSKTCSAKACGCYPWCNN